MTVPLKVIFYPGNTQDIRLIGLQDIDSLLFWNAATASGVLIDPNGNTVMDNIQFVLLPGNLGSYEATIYTPPSLPVQDGYNLILDATENGAFFHLEKAAEVAIRRS